MIKLITSRVVLILVFYLLMYGIYYLKGFENAVLTGFAFLLADNAYSHYNKDGN